MSMLVLLCIPLATSLISISRDITNTKIIRKTTEVYMKEIDPNIRIESLDFETVNSWSKNVSLALKVPQENISQLTDDTKIALTEELANKLEKDISLDVTITPITSVTAKEAKVLSPEQRLRQHINHYLDVMYSDVVSLLGIDYYTDNRRYTTVTLYTEDKIEDKLVFKKQLFDYLQEQEDLIDILALRREENYTEPEKVREQKDDDLDAIRESFNTTFTKETSINNIDLIYQTEGSESLPRRWSLLIALNMKTTIPSTLLQQKLENRKNLLQEQFSKKVELEVIVEQLEKVSI